MQRRGTGLPVAGGHWIATVHVEKEVLNRELEGSRTLLVCLGMRQRRYNPIPASLSVALYDRKSFCGYGFTGVMS